MKKILSGFYLFLIVLSGYAAENISVSGQVKGNLTIDYFNKDSVLYEHSMGDYFLDNYLMFSPKLRFPLTGGVYALCSADIIVQKIIGSKNNQTEQDIDFVLNEAYINIEFAPFLFFTLGKRRLVWGVGLAYNPSDFINPPKDPLNPREERRGVYSALLEAFTEFFSLTQVVVLYDLIDHFGYGTKLATTGLIPATDLNLIFFYSTATGYNLGASIDTTPFGELPVLQNLALHAEAGFSQRSNRLVYESGTGSLEPKGFRTAFYKNFLAGLRYTVPGWETFIACEYYYIDDGYSPCELQAVIDGGEVTGILYEPGLMGRHNLMLTVQQSELTRNTSAFTDTMALSSTLLFNLLDGSFIIQAKAESAIIENCLLSLEAGFYNGKKEAEYGLSPTQFFIGWAAVIGF